jgi:hypothetical protein
MFLPIFKKYYLTYIEVSKINKIWINYSKIKLVCKSILLPLRLIKKLTKLHDIFYTYRSHVLIGVG